MLPTSQNAKEAFGIRREYKGLCRETGLAPRASIGFKGTQETARELQPGQQHFSVAKGFNGAVLDERKTETELC